MNLPTVSTNVSNLFCRKLMGVAVHDKDHRQVINGIFWVLRSGAPWRDMPERYGNWKTVYDRFRRWAEDATLESIVRHL